MNLVGKSQVSEFLGGGQDVEQALGEDWDGREPGRWTERQETRS